MLSKKMAFSLMSLITIFALAFVAPSAMAQDEFAVTFAPADAAVFSSETVDTVIKLKVTTAQPVSNVAGVSTLGLMTEPVLDKDGLVVSYTPVFAPDTDFTGQQTATVRYLTISLPSVGVTNQANLPYTIYIEVPALTTNDPTVTEEKMCAYE